MQKIFKLQAKLGKRNLSIEITQIKICKKTEKLAERDQIMVQVFRFQHQN